LDPATRTAHPVPVESSSLLSSPASPGRKNLETSDGIRRTFRQKHLREQWEEKSRCRRRLSWRFREGEGDLYFEWLLGGEVLSVELLDDC